MEYMQPSLFLRSVYCCQSASNSLCFIPLGIDGGLRIIFIAPASAETFTVVYTPGYHNVNYLCRN